mmetsp:Transcript_25254/g.58146  ORF Transcript_25254/g.58146 Transcript_25254/m.58146 type:complete len:220 (-) Transcript_25254:191-850(-)
MSSQAEKLCAISKVACPPITAAVTRKLHCFAAPACSPRNISTSPTAACTCCSNLLLVCVCIHANRAWPSKVDSTIRVCTTAISEACTDWLATLYQAASIFPTLERLFATSNAELATSALCSALAAEVSLDIRATCLHPKRAVCPSDCQWHRLASTLVTLRKWLRDLALCAWKAISESRNSLVLSTNACQAISTSHSSWHKPPCEVMMSSSKASRRVRQC